jgi:hypothetical protein
MTGDPGAGQCRPGDTGRPARAARDVRHEEGTMPQFWQTVFQIVIAVPLIVLFAYAAWDILRRPDASVLLKLVWLVVCCLFPILGPLVYLVLRPAGTTAALEQGAAGAAASASSLGELAELHDRGKLSDHEYQVAKDRYLGTDASEVVPASVREQRGGQLL